MLKKILKNNRCRVIIGRCRSGAAITSGNKKNFNHSILLGKESVLKNLHIMTTVKTIFNE